MKIAFIDHGGYNITLHRKSIDQKGIDFLSKDLSVSGFYFVSIQSSVC